MMLDAPDTPALENNLRFVKNEFDDQLNTLFEEHKQSPAPFKMIKPYPGLCIKSFKAGTNEKIFINLCHTTEIPAPKDVTESELHKLIEAQNASSFKVPISITKPREGKDKSGNKAYISDVAINSEFFNKKIKRADGLFYHFVITLVFEALEQKHEYAVDADKFTLMKRPCIGELVEHQIYSRDIKTVENFHASQDKNEILGADDSDEIVIGAKKSSSGKALIQEIPSNEHLPAVSRKEEIRIPKANEPEHRLIVDYDEFNRRLLIAEFHLPDVRTIEEVNVDVNDDRLVLESQNHGYKFDGFLPHKINENKARAEYDNERMILKVTMKV